MGDYRESSERGIESKRGEQKLEIAAKQSIELGGLAPFTTWGASLGKLLGSFMPQFPCL